ncbi:stability/partitioning determinant [Acuticoccus sp. I52.16.1]|uniref:stability/partitioning determinant n=1 Tax=Acuticoccus sp. I52.16.1 TaxID=2928472 RepID=UPI001FD25A71|nr:stability/partitioning determinant [Acuticoccus sp. I52.16.1]UOM37192.1 stability/partitioning determinant [Acuticoccus sp. I52.16.1]
MTKSRMSIFGDEADPEFDVSAFTPKPRPQGREDVPTRGPGAPQEVRALAEAMNFKSREAPAPVPAEPRPRAEPRKPRRHRTGRTAQLNVRTTPQTVDAFYAIADQEGWLVGQTVEQALAALQRELAARKA